MLIVGKTHWAECERSRCRVLVRPVLSGVTIPMETSGGLHEVVGVRYVGTYVEPHLVALRHRAVHGLGVGRGVAEAGVALSYPSGDCN